ncbi:MAG: glycosyltransferase family 39 protein [Chthoniobacteraceae bacterium]|nr:glycosyltransferase family 39 protein [Chthoniobacteraceae bacterium]
MTAINASPAQPEPHAAEQGSSVKVPARPWAFWSLFGVLLGISALLLFTQLGHYALWDDETYSAFGAEGILATGDTSAVVGHNVVAFHNGLMLKNLCDRLTPPLPAYVIAVSFRLFGVSAFAARLPFALCGLASIAFIGYWLRKKQATFLRVLLMTIAITGNASLFLYFRQARYYGMAIFCSLVLAYFYCEWKGSWRQITLAALASIGLFGSHYLAYVAVYGALLVDYLAWGRRSIKVRLPDVVWLFVFQALVCVPLALIWNPFGTQHGERLFSNTLLQRLTLIWWNVRDLNRCEFGVGLLLLAAPVFYAWRRDVWWIRGVVAISVYIAVISLLSPQTVSITSVADVRYIVPLIPLCLLVGVLSLEKLTARFPLIAVSLAVVAFHTNILHLGPLVDGDVRFTSASFAGELAYPPGEPYSLAGQWIRENVRPGQSIWVQPGYMTYPLMFQAPQALYAWQLEMPPQPQFSALPAIHFQGLVPPDYMIAFGPVVQPLVAQLTHWDRAKYKLDTVLNVYWKDMYRPELFWRSFVPVRGFNPNTEAVYIFKRIGMAPLKTP